MSYFMKSVKTEKKVVTEDEIDPLSMFAQEKEELEQRQAMTSPDDYIEDIEPSEEGEVYGIYDVPSIEDYFPLLTNERTLMKLPDLLIQLAPGRLVPGTLFMTTYRMAFLPSRAHLASLAASNPSVYSMLNVPLSCIDRIEREKKDSKTVGRTIIVSCKDVRQHKIFLQAKNSDPSCSDVALLSDSEIDRALSAMCTYAFPNDVKFLFAYQHHFPPAGVPALPPYDFMDEVIRLGINEDSILGGASWWRISTINDKYRLCNTYPRTLVVPTKISDEELFSVAGFRSGQRLPILTWLSRDNGASIWRSAQPKSGVSGSCAQDEAFLDAIAHSCSTRISPKGLVTTTGRPLLHILDCRPRTSAMANRAAGAGYESSANYPNTKLDFMDIGNIHVMRTSLKNLIALFTNCVDSPLLDCNIGKAIEDTGWLSHVRLVLRCSWECARLVQRGVPVLVHCSHGWDRTSQVAALAQVMLDPFYRTFEGFRILVEKDWLAAGHPFQWRLGHGQDNSTKQSEETSPIFLQFLDCMQQLVRLYPHYFEYSPRYLLTIADNLYNCRFGTFLGLSEADRDLLETRTRCPDLWTYLHYNRTSLCNPQYLDPLSEDTPTTHLFLPPLAKILRNVTLWVEYFHRWSSVPTVVTPPECISNELNVTGVFQPPKYSDPYPVKRLSSAESASADTTDTYAPRGPVDLNAVKHSDFDVPAMAFQYDYWEAAYRTERYRREELEKQLGLCPSPAVIVDTAAAQDNELRCKTCNGRGVSRIAKADNPAEQSSGADAGTLSDEETEARRSRLTLSKGAEEVTPIVRVQEEVEATVKAALAENAIIVEQQQQVIDSLSRLLLEKGYDQVALEDIVGVVGV